MAPEFHDQPVGQMLAGVERVLTVEPDYRFLGALMLTRDQNEGFWGGRAGHVIAITGLHEGRKATIVDTYKDPRGSDNSHVYRVPFASLERRRPGPGQYAEDEPYILAFLGKQVHFQREPPSVQDALRAYADRSEQIFNHAHENSLTVRDYLREKLWWVNHTHPAGPKMWRVDPEAALRQELVFPERIPDPDSRAFRGWEVRTAQVAENRIKRRLGLGGEAGLDQLDGVLAVGDLMQLVGLKEARELKQLNHVLGFDRRDQRAGFDLTDALLTVVARHYQNRKWPGVTRPMIIMGELRKYIAQKWTDRGNGKR